VLLIPNIRVTRGSSSLVSVKIRVNSRPFVVSRTKRNSFKSSVGRCNHVTIRRSNHSVSRDGASLTPSYEGQIREMWEGLIQKRERGTVRQWQRKIWRRRSGGEGPI
jgi:hypothetical protein